MPRPYKIGVGFIGMCIMLSFPFMFIFVIISFSSLSSLIVSTSLAVCGVFVWYVLEFLKAKDYCVFENKPPERTVSGIELVNITDLEEEQMLR